MPRLRSGSQTCHLGRLLRFRPRSHELKPHRREAAVHVQIFTRDERTGAAREQQNRRAHQLLRFAETLHRRAAHDVFHTFFIEDFPILLRGKEARGMTDEISTSLEDWFVRIHSCGRPIDVGNILIVQTKRSGIVEMCKHCHYERCARNRKRRREARKAAA